MSRQSEERDRRDVQQLNIFFFDLARNGGMRRNFAELKVNNQPSTSYFIIFLNSSKNANLLTTTLIFINNKKSKPTKKHHLRARPSTHFKCFFDLFTFERLQSDDWESCYEIVEDEWES